MEYMPQVKVSKKDYLALSELAGDMSIMDYMSKVIHEHVAAQQGIESDVAYWLCKDCGAYQYKDFDICGDCNTPRGSC